jgi:Holliday junction resolvase-like predicted endonuclease
MMTEKSIQRNLIFYLMRKGFRCFAPNISIRFGEADLLGVRTSGYAEEFEIKVSRSDYMADKRKKCKHLYYADPEKVKQIKAKFMPNKFSYVLASGINPHPIPDYAGMYIVDKNGMIECIKSPPLLHKEKQNWLEKIATTLTWKYIKTL